MSKQFFFYIHKQTLVVLNDNRSEILKYELLKFKITESTYKLDKIEPDLYLNDTIFLFYMCKSSESCKKKTKYGFENFFRTHLPDLVFLVVCSIYKRNSRLYSVHRMVYFF